MSSFNLHTCVLSKCPQPPTNRALLIIDSFGQLNNTEPCNLTWVGCLKELFRGLWVELAAWMELFRGLWVELAAWSCSMVYGLSWLLKWSCSMICWALNSQCWVTLKILSQTLKTLKINSQNTGRLDLLFISPASTYDKESATWDALSRVSMLCSRAEFKNGQEHLPIMKRYDWIWGMNKVDHERMVLHEWKSGRADVEFQFVNNILI